MAFHTRRQMTAYLSFLVYLLAILGFVGLTLLLNTVLGPEAGDRRRSSSSPSSAAPRRSTR
ncbi:MAG: hypothetical protein MZV64_44750 [Ignavibacteriales bacterium]|nr:hypothetical protein [Ignavibacteriales bacterium]